MVFNSGFRPAGVQHHLPFLLAVMGYLLLGLVHDCFSDFKEAMPVKRKLTVICIVIAVLVLAYAAWLCAYRSQKSNDNLPGLASIAAMGEEEINKSVCGYQRTQLNGMWGEPDEAGEAEDIWSLGDDRSLRVNYNKKENIV